MEPRNWKIVIPVRPKAVQSTRGDRGRFHVDSKVRAWKAMILPYIKAQAFGEPSTLPIWFKRARYIFKLPKSAPKSVIRYVQQGGEVVYEAAGDLHDNLNKGVVDVCTGIIFVDDRLIVRLGDFRKLYGLEDRIELEFEEIPDAVRADGTIASDSPRDMLF